VFCLRAGADSALALCERADDLTRKRLPQVYRHGSRST
jgi:hypothetical protein